MLDSTAAVAPATLRSFAWLGGTSSGNWPGGAEDLRPLVLDDHHRLAAEVPAAAHRWTGSLSWPPPPAAAPGQRLVDQAEIAEMEPHLRRLPDSALHIPTDGGLDPLTAVPALLQAAQDLGARFLPRTPFSPHSVPPGATVIFAAGSATPGLAGAVLPVTAQSAFGMRVAAPRPSGPAHHRDSRLPGTRGAPRTVSARRSLDRGVRRGHYVAVLHAGVTSAPTVGRLLATGIRTGEPVPELHRCRPSSISDRRRP